MSDMKVQSLADNPAGEDQLTRARELCANSETLKAKLAEFLTGNPTRGQMVDFLGQLRVEGLKAGFDANILRICEAVGVTEPTGTDRLLALQISLLREQNELLTSLAKRAGRIEDEIKDLPFQTSGFLTGFLFGKL
jgi:hypothetical protein